MLTLKLQQSIGCYLLLLTVNLSVLQSASAEQSKVQASMNNFYDNLLHREYAGPIVFPNHQVERKAQRSPSLRLRFGRSDPEILSNFVEKRWFGDVNQKPIRSPSLRLRFGRRSDPTLPQMRRTAYDDLFERELTLNSQLNMDDGYKATDYDGNDPSFKRVLRKPQRLRWGRSIVTKLIDIGNHFDDKNQQKQALLERQWLQLIEMTNTLLALQQKYSSATEHSSLFNENTDVKSDAENSGYLFRREARKPMRLRWGRSIGKSSAEQKITQVSETAHASTKPN